MEYWAEFLTAFLIVASFAFLGFIVIIITTGDNIDNRVDFITNLIKYDIRLIEAGDGKFHIQYGDKKETRYDTWKTFDGNAYTNLHIAKWKFKWLINKQKKLKTWFEEETGNDTIKGQVRRVIM